MFAHKACVHVVDFCSAPAFRSVSSHSVIKYYSHPAGMVCGMVPRQRGQRQNQTVSPGPPPPTQPQGQPPYSRTPVTNY